MIRARILTLLLLPAILLFSLHDAAAQQSAERAPSERVARVKPPKPASLKGASGKAFDRGIEAITLTTARPALYFLASDALRGRFAGSPEGLITAEYLVCALSQMGYTPTVQRFTGRKGESLQNILVDIPGRNATERIIAGAHYDHEGVKDGQVYNGADDNASGTVAILEIARALKVAGVQPQRSITLALWDGEERGLQGSRHYVAGIVDTSSVKYYFNFDIIGRNNDPKNPTHFDYFFTEANGELATMLGQGIEHCGLSLVPIHHPWDKPVGGSDNAPFARRMIPIAWFHTNGHEDFHKPTDTADKINYPKLLDIIRAGYYMIWRTAY